MILQVKVGSDLVEAIEVYLSDNRQYCDERSDA